MNELSDELTRAWAALSRPKHSELAAFPLAAEADGVACQVAVDAQNLRHVLVPAPSSFAANSWTGENLNVVVRTLSFGMGANNYVDIFCADRGLDDEFDDVVRDVLEEVQCATEPAKAALACVGRWRRLFRSRLVIGLGPEERRGLFAELAVLGAVLDQDKEVTVEAWTGPAREPHDFELPSRCVEVKAVSAASASIVVHGIDQLASHDDRPLRLLLIGVEERPDGFSLDDMVEVVAQKRPGQATDLRKRLSSVGFAGGLYPARYSIDEVTIVDVDDNTPALGPSDLVVGHLANGLSRLSYRVDLDPLYACGIRSSLSGAVSDL